MNDPTKLQTHINNMEDVDDDNKVSNILLFFNLFFLMFASLMRNLQVSCGSVLFDGYAICKV